MSELLLNKRNWQCCVICSLC